MSPRTRPRCRRGRRRRERICDCRCSSCRSSAGHRNRGRRRSHRTRTCPNAPLTRATRTRWALRSHIYPRLRDPDARCSCSVALPPHPSAPTAPIYALLAAASAFLLPPSTLPTAAFDIPYPISHIPSQPHTHHTTPTSLTSTTTASHKPTQTTLSLPPSHMSPSPRTFSWHMFSGRRSGSRRRLPRYAWALILNQSSLWNDAERQSEKERERRGERKGRRTSYIRSPAQTPTSHHAPRFWMPMLVCLCLCLCEHAG